MKIIFEDSILKERHEYEITYIEFYDKIYKSFIKEKESWKNNVANRL